jgi:hypothetical protein
MNERLIETADGPVVFRLMTATGRFEVTATRYDDEGWVVGEDRWSEGEAVPPETLPDRALLEHPELVTFVEAIIGPGSEGARAVADGLLREWLASGGPEKYDHVGTWGVRLGLAFIVGSALALFGCGAAVWIALNGWP